MCDIMQRLERLEHRNLLLTRCLAALRVLLVTLVGAAWKSPDGTVEAQKLVITDENGNAIVVLGKGENGQSGMFLKRGDATLLSATLDAEGLPRLTCSGGEGKHGNVLIGVKASVGAFISLRPPDCDRESLGLIAEKSGSTLRIHDKDGDSTLLIKSSGDTASLHVLGGGLGISMKSTFSDGSELLITDSLKQARFCVRVPPRQDPQLWIAGEDGSAKWEAGK